MPEKKIFWLFFTGQIALFLLPSSFQACYSSYDYIKKGGKGKRVEKEFCGEENLTKPARCDQRINCYRLR
jgi:hypothetical protein